MKPNINELKTVPKVDTDKGKKIFYCLVVAD
jgi:hypothetical protein